MKNGIFDIHKSVIISWIFSKFDRFPSECSIIFKFFQLIFLKIDALSLRIFDSKQIKESYIISSLLGMERLFGYFFIFSYCLIMIVSDDRWKNIYIIPFLFVFSIFYFLSVKKRNINSLEIKLGFEVFDFTFLVFHIFFITATIFSKRVEISISYLLLVFLLFVWCFFVVNYFIDEKSLNSLSNGIAFAVILESIVAVIFMMVFMKEVNLHYYDSNLTMGFRDRMHGSFGNPNILAEFLILSIPFLFTAILNAKNKMRYLWILGLIPAFYVLVKTGSRASWIAILFSIFLFVFMKKPKYIIFLFILGIGLLFVVPDSVYVRFMSIFNSQDRSMGYRWKIYESTLTMIFKNPFGIGLGAGVYQSMLKDYKVFGLHHIAHSHNIFLQIWAEQGIFALISFLIMMLSVTVKTMWYNHSEDDEINNIMLAAFCSFAGIMVVGLTEHIWFYYRIHIALWTNLSILFLSFRLKKIKQKKQKY